MDQTTVDRLRHELTSDRDQQLEVLAEHGADPYDDEVTHDLGIDSDSFADSAQATEERSEVLGQIEFSQQRVHAIDEALRRIEDGSYGTCAVCGDAIPVERLEARPLSVRCVRCADAA